MPAKSRRMCLAVLLKRASDCWERFVRCQRPCFPSASSGRFSICSYLCLLALLSKSTRPAASRLPSRCWSTVSKTFVWLPRGNRASSRPTVALTRPSRIRDCTSSANLSTSESRRHTQLLSRSSNWPTSTWVNPSCRHNDRTTQASSMSHTPLEAQFRLSSAALATRALISITRARSESIPSICRPARNLLNPSTSSYSAEAPRHTTTGDICPYLCNDKSICCSVFG